MNGPLGSLLFAVILMLLRGSLIVLASIVPVLLIGIGGFYVTIAAYALLAMGHKETIVKKGYAISNATFAQQQNAAQAELQQKWASLQAALNHALAQKQKAETALSLMKQ